MLSSEELLRDFPNVGYADQRELPILQIIELGTGELMDDAVNHVEVGGGHTFIRSYRMGGNGIRRINDGQFVLRKTFRRRVGRHRSALRRSLDFSESDWVNRMRALFLASQPEKDQENPRHKSNKSQNGSI